MANLTTQNQLIVDNADRAWKSIESASNRQSAEGMQASQQAADTLKQAAQHNHEARQLMATGDIEGARQASAQAHDLVVQANQLLDNADARLHATGERLGGEAFALTFENIQQAGKEKLQGAQFQNDDEQRAAGEAFAGLMFDKETGRITTLEDSRQAFEERLAKLGIEATRASQIADQLFSREERVAGQEFALTFENLQQTGADAPAGGRICQRG